MPCDKLGSASEILLELYASCWTHSFNKKIINMICFIQVNKDKKQQWNLQKSQVIKGWIKLRKKFYSILLPRMQDLFKIKVVPVLPLL